MNKEAASISETLTICQTTRRNIWGDSEIFMFMFVMRLCCWINEGTRGRPSDRLRDECWTLCCTWGAQEAGNGAADVFCCIRLSHAQSTGSIDWRAQCCSLNRFLAGQKTGQTRALQHTADRHPRVSRSGTARTNRQRFPGGGGFWPAVPIICQSVDSCYCLKDCARIPEAMNCI
jgi:hypothetical protein